MDHMLDICNSIATLNIDKFETYLVNDISYMFNQYKKFDSINLKNFNMRDVWHKKCFIMNSFISVALSFESVDVSLFRGVDSMFADCTSLAILDLSNFVSKKM